MGNPNYPNYPPGGPPGGGYPGQQYPQGGGYPQQPPAPAQPPAAPPPEPPKPAGPRTPSPLAPPPGAAKMLYIGLILMIFAFAVKQIFVDVSINSSTSMLDKEKIAAQQASEIAEIDSALDSIDDEIAEQQDAMPKPPSDDKDMDSFQEKTKKIQDKLDKLKKDRDDKDKDLEDKRKEVRKKYRAELRQAGRAEQSSQASTIGKIQITFLLKLILDFFKIAGAAIAILAGLSIAADAEQTSGMKAFAAVMSGVAFLAVVAGGLASLLS